MNMHIDPGMLREILDRARRTETRVTKISLALRVNPGVEKPYWSNRSVVVPSRDCPISDISVTVPIDWPSDREFEVVIGSDHVCFMRVGAPSHC